MTNELKQLKNTLLHLCEEAQLDLRFEPRQGELSNAQEFAFLDLKEHNPDAAVALGFQGKSLARIFFLAELEDGANAYVFAEIAQNFRAYNYATLADDGVWDIDEIETRQGANW